MNSDDFWSGDAPPPNFGVQTKPSYWARSPAASSVGNSVAQTNASAASLQPKADSQPLQIGLQRRGLPDNVARYNVGDTQLYAGVGAHGEPAFSDTLAGIQRATSGLQRRGAPTVPASVDTGDPNAVQRRAVGALQNQDVSGYPGGTIGDVPDQYRQPQGASSSWNSDAAKTGAFVAGLRRRPGGDQPFAANSFGTEPGDDTGLTPMQRQARINALSQMQYGDTPDEQERRAADRGLLRRLQGGMTGPYNPTGYGGQQGAGYNGLNPLQLMQYGLRRDVAERTQNRADAEFGAKQEKEAQTRAERDRDRYLDEAKSQGLSGNEASDYAAVRALRDNVAANPKYADSNIGQQGLRALARELNAVSGARRSHWLGMPAVNDVDAVASLPYYSAARNYIPALHGGRQFALRSPAYDQNTDPATASTTPYRMARRPVGPSDQNYFSSNDPVDSQMSPLGRSLFGDDLSGLPDTLTTLETIRRAREGGK